MLRAVGCSIHYQGSGLAMGRSSSDRLPGRVAAGACVTRKAEWTPAGGLAIPQLRTVRAKYLLRAYAFGDGCRSASSNGICVGTVPSVSRPVAISLEA
jgi:hypothetical protein